MLVVGTACHLRSVDSAEKDSKVEQKQEGREGVEVGSGAAAFGIVHD